MFFYNDLSRAGRLAGIQFSYYERIGCRMSIQAHIDSLLHKRAFLKQRIAEESARPMPNFKIITDLKKQNLMFKEEMQRYLILMGEKRYNTSS